MKYLVAALCFFAASTLFGQNQTLMVNTNFTLIQANTNPLVFQSPIGFGTNTTFQAQSRTNLGITAIGNSVATATNTTAAQNAIGISATNTITVSNIDIDAFGLGSQTGFVGRANDGTLLLRGTNVTTAVPSFFGWDGFSATAMGAGTSRTNLGLPLPALTNANNTTVMRALSGSTNTNHPFSGTVSVVGTNNTNTLTFSNGILQSVQ